ncbi:Glycosyltransferase family 61 protein [Klebsormidium nitens]|uniref:Glycosyltransferase family 61 protein n=1 Tax=Klebsormidium nitens TaxID=105231 RepID=A0A1Y1IE56_KLENI|nr:Glycosyltransferase family 61 protein [Klebsormidium nitens]|eukprot:GAQ86368.1 Glycosyltransferase family 61 protein [Klebsormidium nitens]
MLPWGAAAMSRAPNINCCVAAFFLIAAWSGLPVAIGRLELECDFSSALTDVCTLQGDVRIDVTSGQIVLFSRDPQTEPGEMGFRPHPRKWDKGLMESQVSELPVRVVAHDDPSAPLMKCSRNNTAPGVVFSAGGYSGGPFHDFNEVFLPLFETTRGYDRNVVMLMSDLKGEWWWRDNPPKRSFVGAMTEHAIRLIGLENDTYSRAQGVECFSNLTLGLYHSLCMYDENGGFQSRAASGTILQEFGAYMRKGLRVPEPESSRVFVPAGATPVVGIVQRNTTRQFLNYGELIRAAQGENFTVVPIMFEALNHPEMAQTMASLDVLVAVHGAGLSNICLMRPGGAVLQVMPYGEGGSRDVTGMEYKNFAQEMELEYYEWRVPVQDSTILEQYNHRDGVEAPLQGGRHVSVPQPGCRHAGGPARGVSASDQTDAQRQSRHCDSDCLGLPPHRLQQLISCYPLQS